MNRTHYHVIENTPGYLPESEPYVCRKAGDARAYLADLAYSLREDGYKRQSGSLRAGYLEFAQGSDDLGRVIEMIPCDDAACWDHYINGPDC